MSLYSPSIEKLIESFERLPSIGHKTAARLAFHMLNASEEETNEFHPELVDKLRYNGNIFALPFYATSPVTVYNQKTLNTQLVLQITVLSFQRKTESSLASQVLDRCIPLNIQNRPHY